jgi:hypothetical protein
VSSLKLSVIWRGSASRITALVGTSPADLRPDDCVIATRYKPGSLMSGGGSPTGSNPASGNYSCDLLPTCVYCGVRLGVERPKSMLQEPAI